MRTSSFLSAYGRGSKYLILTGLCLGSLGIMVIISLFLSAMLYDVPFQKIPSLLNDYSNPNTIPILKLMQTFQAIGLFILPAFIYARLDSKDAGQYLGFKKSPGMYGVFVVMFLMIGAQALINWLAEVNSYIPVPQWMRDSEASAAEITKLFLQTNTLGGLAINLFMIGFLPGLGEELLFRGIIQKMIKTQTGSKHLGIWFSAILFSAMHMQFLGFIPRMLLGALLGYLYEWSGSIWLPVLAHFFNNGMAVLIAWLIGRGVINSTAETIGSESIGSVFALASLIITVVLLYMLNKHYLKRVVVLGEDEGTEG